MKLYDMGLTAVIAIVVTAAIVGYASQKWLGPDNAVEEFCEEEIKAETGVSIDLSPGSQDKDLPAGSVIQFKK